MSAKSVADELLIEPGTTVWSALRFRALKEGEAPFTGGAG
jgi:hypothetical protein